MRREKRRGALALSVYEIEESPRPPTATAATMNLFPVIMRLPLPALFLVMATLGLALVMNYTQLTMVRPTPNSLSLALLPNPFPVPGTDITLDFLPQPSFFPQPPETDVVRIIAIAESEIEGYIRTQGDSPIMHHLYDLVYKQVEITLYSSNAPLNAFKYSDALSALYGISLKMAREGVSNIAARVLRTGNPETIGLAAIYRHGIGRDIFA
ncbi:hypothetical protein BDR22DRAFT_124623 [Usnea florida]